MLKRTKFLSQLNKAIRPARPAVLSTTQAAQEAQQQQPNIVADGPDEPKCLGSIITRPELLPFPRRLFRSLARSPPAHLLTARMGLMSPSAASVIIDARSATGAWPGRARRGGLIRLGGRGRSSTARTASAATSPADPSPACLHHPCPSRLAGPRRRSRRRRRPPGICRNMPLARSLPHRRQPAPPVPNTVS